VARLAERRGFLRDAAANLTPSVASFEVKSFVSRERRHDVARVRDDGGTRREGAGKKGAVRAVGCARA
jgi:hypothetical protein